MLSKQQPTAIQSKRQYLFSTTQEVKNKVMCIAVVLNLLLFTTLGAQYSIMRPPFNKSKLFPNIRGVFLPSVTCKTYYE